MDRALQSGAATEAIDGVLPLLSEDEAYRLQKLPNHVELTSPKTASFFFLRLRSNGCKVQSTGGDDMGRELE